MTRRAVLCAGLQAAAAPYVFAQRSKDAPAKNVLLLIVDDLRPMLGCYGNPDMITPNIDALAKRGLTFLNNHCQLASDVPSRQSIFSGFRPDTINVFNNTSDFRTQRPNAVTLPQYFRQNGYYTSTAGNVFPDAPSWNEADERAAEASFARSWGQIASSDSELFDGQTAARAIAALEGLSGRKFFMAVGFERPSLPFAVPESYFNLYPRAYVKSLNELSPKGAPAYAFPDEGELQLYGDIQQEVRVDRELSRDLVRAYMASVSYVDAQIGLVLKALEQQGLQDDTAIVLLSDSGFHLGELGYWGKQANFELATRTPLIVSSLGLKSAGRKSRALTELVDVYPSLCELAGLPIPANLDGATLTLLFENPDRLWKRAVFSQQPREIPGIGAAMGHSMRADRYRYTEWTALGGAYKTVELYDYKNQPLEVENLAHEPGMQTLTNGLSAMMREGWRASLPPSDPRSGTSS